MGETDLRAAIEGPAHQAGLLLEPGLVELLVQDVEGEPGALPLLSHALRTTWERREGRTLTVDGYRATGGIRGAVAQSAEALYEQVPADRRPLLRDLMLRLVAPGPDGQPVRNRVPRRNVATDAAHDEIIERLVSARLVTSDEGVVQLAHEALARAWPRLQGWLDEDVEGQRILRHLAGAADTWDTMGRPDSELYRGTRLARALDWRERSTPDLTPTERTFLDSSQTLADTERRASEDRARHQARQNRRLRALLTATAIFLVGALITGFVAVGQRDRAERAGQIATARELAAAANANIDIDPERSILLALAAVDQSRGDDAGSVLPEAEEALHRAVTASRIELRIPGIGGRLDWSPDGTVFVTEGPEDSGIVDIRDAQTGETVRSVAGHDGDILDVAFNHDGTLLATTGDDGAARIWRTATGDELHTVRMPVTDDTWGAEGPSFSHDGSLFAAAWPGEGLVKVIDLASGRIVREIRSVASPNGTTFDPTGPRLAITSWEDPTTVVDLAAGDEAFALDELLLYPIMDAAWSPDGQSIATAGFDGGVRVFEGGTGHQRFSIHGTGGHVFDVDWAPDSASLVAGKSDGTARVWVVDEGGAREVITLSAHDTRKGIEGVAFSPDGTRVLTGDLGVTAARVWDVGIDGNAEVANLPAVVATFGAVDFTSDGRQLVASSGAGSVTVWDAQSFTRRRTLGVPSRSPTAAAQDAAPGYDAPLASGADVFSVDVSPDGRLVAAARFDGSVRVWDMETGRDAFTVDAGPLQGTYGTVSWNPDGDLLAIAANDGRTGRATVVDRSGKVVAVRQEEFGIALMGLTFTPDSAGLVTTRLATGPTSPDVGGVVRWDWREGGVAPIIDTRASLALSSPTGRLVATAGPLRTLVGSGGPGEIWDPATGRRVATLAGNTGAVLDLAFSADETRLAVSGQDGIVGIWDPTSGEQLLVLRGHYAGVFSVAFSPDGSRLASVGSEGVVRVWTLDIDELVEIAEDELTRTLTDDECQQYLHQQRCG